jgi:hypothetical protein
MNPFDRIGQRLTNFNSLYDDDGPSAMVQESRPMFKDGTPVKFDESRVKIPTGKFAGKGRDKSQIFKIKNNTTGSVRYTTTGAGGGKKKLYKSVKELKDAKLESLPDEFFVQSETPYKNGIKEITSKNRKTGETKVFYKPRVGPDKATLPGKGAETKKEAQKFIDNYFKENPKQVRVRDPKKDYASKDVRTKALKETDLTKAEGTPKYNYHHVRQIAGGVPLTTDDVLIINQRINSSLGTKYNKPLNEISAAIQKNNRLALEAMNNKQEGLALDYMKRVDELNTSAEKIVNSAIDKLPKKYKGYVGFNQFTLPTNEYGLPISNEPMIIKKVGGMPVSKDAVDLTTLDLKQEKEFRKIVKAQAEAGKIGQIKNIKFLTSKHQQLIKNQFCPGNKVGGPPGSCDISEAMDNMLKQTNAVKQGAIKGTEATRVAQKASKVARFGTGRALAKVLGPLGLGAEAVFEVAMAVPGLARGKSGKRILGDSLLGLIPGVGQSEEEEFAEYATKDGMSQLEQQKIKDVNKFLELNDALPLAYKNINKGGRGDPLKGAKNFERLYNEFSPLYNQFVGGPPSESASTAFAEQQRINDLIKADEAKRALKDKFSMNEDFMAAGGGIAKIAGDRSGAMLTSMNPDSQGLSGILKRVKKIKE